MRHYTIEINRITKNKNWKCELFTHYEKTNQSLVSPRECRNLVVENENLNNSISGVDKWSSETSINDLRQLLQSE